MPNPPSPSTPKRGEPVIAKHALLGTGCGTHRLARRTLRAGRDRTFDLFTATPNHAPPAGGFPILYMLDGNAAFDSLSADALEAAPDLIIAAIGYPTPFRFDVLSRNLDYTPLPRGAACPVPDPQRPERLVGGAPGFLDILCGPLRNAVEDGLPVDPSRRAIWGHSLAGLFVVHALLSRPVAFAAYIAASPSIWWGDELLLEMEEKTGMPAGLRSRILVMLSDSERRSSPGAPLWSGPAPATLALAARLERRPGLDVSLRVFAGLAHAETLAASLQPALEFAA